MSEGRRREAFLTLGYGVTLFVAAALLFCVEPMVAKMLMPVLGGAAAVWITCMLFFQAALLLGYGYAHASTARFGARRQALLHLAVLALPFLVLPIHVRAAEAVALGHEARPVLPLLGVLAGMVGLPFFVVGATAPLVQKWFSEVSRGGGKDPYFLYGASNFGSLLALAAYPAVIEPWIGLTMQARLWAWGYAALALLVGGAALGVVFARREAAPAPVHGVAAPEVAETVTVMRRARWIFFSFVPSSFLLGVTTYITTDVSAIPLFWVIPLALYLLTFILVFARRPPLPHAKVARVLPFFACVTAVLLVIQASTPLAFILAAHLVTFFLAAMVCHGELAKDRPEARHLTGYYLWVSVGGVLGGVANGLVAPVVFDRLLEYPIALVLALACRRTVTDGVARPFAAPTKEDLAFAALVLVVTAGLMKLGPVLHLDPLGVGFTLLLVVPVFLAYGQLERPTRFALAVGGLLVGGAAFDAASSRRVHIERNFFGVSQVTRDLEGRFTQIAHGNTVHGRQWRDPSKRDEPTAYYTRKGPLGQVFGEFAAREEGLGRPGRVGIVGLGAGGMAAYANASDAWTFYEINPSMVRIAEDPRYFTFLEDAFDASGRLSIVVGDARLRLGDVPNGTYDLLVVDAFSSDAIPAHLLTREALAVYEAKLTEAGMLVIHISNRYLDLAPVVARLATDAHILGFVRADLTAGPTADADGWTPSIWTALFRDSAPPRALAADPRWKELPEDRRPPWTDDFSNLLQAVHW